MASPASVGHWIFPRSTLFSNSASKYRKFAYGVGAERLCVGFLLISAMELSESLT